MTSTKVVQAEINRFLASETPEVLCITGKWGVGKTYAWKHFLSLAQTSKAIALNRYSYYFAFRTELSQRTSIIHI